MTLLKEISLSNIRRFAENVIVPVSPQATILLAPNGTGKTALFEAIELALTGSVARLDKDMFALVREGMAHAEVRLDFGDFEHRASVSADATPVYWSGRSELHGTVNPDDFGYLLRLTHMLDQRDKDWFTQAESSNAGDQLTKLPIGKDAQRANALITGLKQAVTKERTERERVSTEAETCVRDWNDLIKQRNDARELLNQELPSVEQLVTVLQRYVSAKINSDNLDNLESVQAVSVSNINTQLQELRERYVGLRQMDEVCTAYSTAMTELERLKGLKTIQQNFHDDLARKRDVLAINVTQATAAHIEADLGLSRVRDELAKVKEWVRLDTLLKAENDALTSEHLALTQLVGERTSASSTLKASEDVDYAYIKLSATSDEWQSSVNELQENLRAWSNWRDDSLQIETLQGRVKDIQKELLNNKKLFEEKEASYKQALDREAKAKEQLSLFQQSSDSLRAALAAIAADLPENQGECPVCGVEHGVNELRKRMANQLQAINPSLLSLAEYERTCREVVAQSDREKAEVSQLYLQSVALNESTVTEIGALERRVDAVRRLKIFEDTNLETANERLSARSKELEIAKLALDEFSKTLPPRPSAETLVHNRQVVHRLIELENEGEQIVRRRQATVSLLEQQLSMLPSSDDPVKAMKNLEEEASVSGKSVDSKLSERRQAEANAEIETANLQQSQGVIDALHNESQYHLGRIDECRKQWLLLRLPDEPTHSVLALNLHDCESKISSMEGAISELGQIRQSIVRLRSAVDYRKLQELIDTQRAERSEPDHGTYLVHQFEAAANELNRVDMAKSTLNTFSSALTNEVNEIESRLLDIEPLWQSLLGRIVREPRFSQTELQYNHYRKKAYAQVQVPIGNREAPAYKVASEAQKTDLQLSFLLSMAQVHPWSPWKALLLDDPTQHHDLVHASAVFDVLRDYIVDHGFQTIVTTHDPTQARFFARKLINDGVNVELVTLVPMGGGVNVMPLQNNR
ncbi:AAA family ATPase [Pantoea endophytica]|uniref:AAA family ATPase n=1 Tax=Pantoea endophytica TaxID=92488 RepID=UPI002412F850|nr:AAA family ATPase [Pantoea endophytica]